MTPDWQLSAAALWGEDWIAPMSEVMQINRRTIERWRAGFGEPSDPMRQDLWWLAKVPQARAIGLVLRRLARGDAFEDIWGDARDLIAAVRTVSNAISGAQCQTIPVLRATEPRGTTQ